MSVFQSSQTTIMLSQWKTYPLERTQRGLVLLRPGDKKDVFLKTVSDNGVEALRIESYTPSGERSTLCSVKKVQRSLHGWYTFNFVWGKTRVLFHECLPMADYTFGDEIFRLMQTGSSIDIYRLHRNRGYSLVDSWSSWRRRFDENDPRLYASKVTKDYLSGAYRIGLVVPRKHIAIELDEAHFVVHLAVLLVLTKLSEMSNIFGDSAILPKKRRLRSSDLLVKVVLRPVEKSIQH